MEVLVDMYLVDSAGDKSSALSERMASLTAYFTQGNTPWFTYPVYHALSGRTYSDLSTSRIARWVSLLPTLVPQEQPFWIENSTFPRAGLRISTVVEKQAFLFDGHTSSDSTIQLN